MASPRTHLLGHPAHLEDLEMNLLSKENIKRMEKYLNYVRQLPCVVCKNTSRSQAAHVRYLGICGIGLKPDDTKFTVPLCDKCHKEQHAYNDGEKTEQSAEEKWWRTKDINPEKITTMLYEVFFKFGMPGALYVASDYIKVAGKVGVGTWKS